MSVLGSTGTHKHMLTLLLCWGIRIHTGIVGLSGTSHLQHREGLLLTFVLLSLSFPFTFEFILLLHGWANFFNLRAI
jgi:hypothetical protein